MQNSGSSSCVCCVIFVVLKLLQMKIREKALREEQRSKNQRHYSIDRISVSSSGDILLCISCLSVCSSLCERTSCNQETEEDDESR